MPGGMPATDDFLPLPMTLMVQKARYAMSLCKVGGVLMRGARTHHLQKRMRALLVIFATGLFGSISHVVEAADAVPNEGAAIAAVKAIFFASRPAPQALNGRDWHARLRGSQWQVWFGSDYGSDVELPCLPFVFFVSRTDERVAFSRTCIPEPPPPPPPPPSK